MGFPFKQSIFVESASRDGVKGQFPTVSTTRFVKHQRRVSHEVSRVSGFEFYQLLFSRKHLKRGVTGLIYESIRTKPTTIDRNK